MENIIETYGLLTITLLTGALSGLLFKKLKVPAALMIGAFAGVAVLNIAFGFTYMPSWTKTAVQIVSGAFVGCSMERSDAKRLRFIIKPALVMLGLLLILNVVIGFLIYLTSPLDLVTALMSAVPGGVNDTAIVAADMGADAPVVAVMQLVRQVLGIGVFPVLIGIYDRTHKDAEAGEDTAYSEKRVKSKQKSWQALVTTLIVATAAGLLGRASGIPAATFSFAIIAVLVCKLVFDFAYLPKPAKKATQVVAGSYLGTLVTLSSVLNMKMLLIPIALLIAGYAINDVVVGSLMHRYLGFSKAAGLLVGCPAGASDMALISEDLNVRNTDVIVLQVIRAVVVMAFFPQIVNLIVHHAHF